MSSLTDELRDALGMDVLLSEVRMLRAEVAALTATKPFYSVDDVRELLGVRKSEVERMLADGRLWLLEGLSTSKRLIPAAAVESLQARPQLRSVAS